MNRTLTESPLLKLFLTGLIAGYNWAKWGDRQP